MILVSKICLKHHYYQWFKEKLSTAIMLEWWINCCFVHVVFRKPKNHLIFDAPKLCNKHKGFAKMSVSLREESFVQLNIFVRWDSDVRFNPPLRKPPERALCAHAMGTLLYIAT